MLLFVCFGVGCLCFLLGLGFICLFCFALGFCGGFCLFDVDFGLGGGVVCGVFCVGFWGEFGSGFFVVFWGCFFFLGGGGLSGDCGWLSLILCFVCFRSRWRFFMLFALLLFACCCCCLLAIYGVTKAVICAILSVGWCV